MATLDTLNTFAKQAATAEKALKQNNANAQKLSAGIDEAEARQQRDFNSMQQKLGGFQRQLFAAQQRRRLITVNRAQTMKKLFPMAAIFALIGGGVAGTAGALSALAGGLAGFKTGEDQQYKRAVNQWSDNFNATLQRAQMQIGAVNEVMDNDKLNIDQKMEQLRAVTAGNPYLAHVVESSQNNASRVFDSIEKYKGAVLKAEAAHRASAHQLAAPNSGMVKTAERTLLSLGYLTAPAPAGSTTKQAFAAPGTSTPAKHVPLTDYPPLASSVIHDTATLALQAMYREPAKYKNNFQAALNDTIVHLHAMGLIAPTRAAVTKLNADIAAGGLAPETETVEADKTYTVNGKTITGEQIISYAHKVHETPEQVLEAARAGH